MEGEMRELTNADPLSLTIHVLGAYRNSARNESIKSKLHKMHYQYRPILLKERSIKSDNIP